MTAALIASCGIGENTEKIHNKNNVPCGALGVIKVHPEYDTIKTKKDVHVYNKIYRYYCHTKLEHGLRSNLSIK